MIDRFKGLPPLKPCPFCGATIGCLYIVTIPGTRWSGYNDTTAIFCDSCKQTVMLEWNEAEGDTMETRTRAIEAWNRRSE